MKTVMNSDDIMSEFHKVVVSWKDKGILITNGSLIGALHVMIGLAQTHEAMEFKKRLKKRLKQERKEAKREANK